MWVEWSVVAEMVNALVANISINIINILQIKITAIIIVIIIVIILIIFAIIIVIIVTIAITIVLLQSLERWEEDFLLLSLSHA